MSDAAFDITDIQEALEGTSTIEEKAHGVQPDGPPTDKEAAIAKVREHGFGERFSYDYAAYGVKAGNGDEDTPLPAYNWAGNARRYEFEDEYGDIGPRVPELEEELFGKGSNAKLGANMSNLDDFKVTMEGPMPIDFVEQFADAGLHPVIMENVGFCHYAKPTPIQKYCIPAVLGGNDVVACAQTGSGKTAAFLIPILSKLAGKYKTLAAKRPSARDLNPKTDRVRAEPLVLIVVPTRELAVQIFDETRRFSYRTMFRPCVVYGGGPWAQQKMDLQRGCDILIATPGRLLDFMSNPGVLSLKRLKFTVIDEADEMLHGAWEQEMSTIMSGGDNNEDPDHLYMMFSATFPSAARKLARDYMRENYMRIRVGRAGSTHQNITQSIIYVEQNLKNKALWDLLFSNKVCRTLIFVNSKRQADMVDDYLYNNNLPSTSIHSARTQREREDAMLAFKNGKAPLLVTTGVAARGLDIKGVMHVINYDLPSAQHGGIDEYVHRIGRTARIGNHGIASSFFNGRNEDIADDLVKILLENKQEVPDFLQSRIPEELTFDDASERGSNARDDNKENGVEPIWGAERTTTELAEEGTNGFNADLGDGGGW